MALFRAQIDPSERAIDAIARCSPENPFYTGAYAATRAKRGETVVSLAIHEGEQVVAGCLGFLSQGWRSRMLEIPSTPNPPEPEPFWSGVRAFCERAHIGKLDVLSFGSPRVNIPRMGNETSRRERSEFVLDLTADALWTAMSANHRRNVKKAEKTGIAIVTTREPRCCELHARLIGLSMLRRADRGENVSTAVDGARLNDFLEAGAGELFQATHGDDVVSSVLVLLAPRGGYYHSAGTSPAGREEGASQHLIASIAELLRSRGMTCFNLGGADETEEGLHRFKSGFGARKVPLEAAEFAFGSSTTNAVTAIAYKLRQTAATSLSRRTR